MEGKCRKMLVGDEEGGKRWAEMMLLLLLSRTAESEERNADILRTQKDRSASAPALHQHLAHHELTVQETPPAHAKTKSPSLDAYLHRLPPQEEAGHGQRARQGRVMEGRPRVARLDGPCRRLGRRRMLVLLVVTRGVLLLLVVVRVMLTRRRLLEHVVGGEVQSAQTERLVVLLLLTTEFGGRHTPLDGRGRVDVTHSRRGRRGGEGRIRLLEKLLLPGEARGGRGGGGRIRHGTIKRRAGLLLLLLLVLLPGVATSLAPASSSTTTATVAHTRSRTLDRRGPTQTLLLPSEAAPASRAELSDWHIPLVFSTGRELGLVVVGRRLMCTPLLLLMVLRLLSEVESGRGCRVRVVKCERVGMRLRGVVHVVRVQLLADSSGRRWRRLTIGTRTRATRGGRGGGRFGGGCGDCSRLRVVVGRVGSDCCSCRLLVAARCGFGGGRRRVRVALNGRR